MSADIFNIIQDKKNDSSCSTTGLSVSEPENTPGVLAEGNFAGNVLVVTLGCAKNTVDSEVMLGALKSRGFRPVSSAENADLIVVNTCAFLTSAVEESIQRILEMAKYKQTGRCKRLIVAGCMVERYRADLQASLPEVDRFVSTDELLSVADDSSTTEQALNAARRPYFLYDESMPRLRSTLGHTAYVKISEGCNRPCTFCIIPKIRGALRSRPIESILSEIQTLVQEGVKEINFVAQDLTSYGADLDKKIKLLHLLESINLLSTKLAPFWLRLLYAYPIGIDEQLIRCIQESKPLVKYLDLPLQHISHPVLKAMHRPLGERGTRGLIEQIRTLAPEIALRTTFIVGFPGETEADVQALESFIAEGHFTHVGIFTYSQEEEAKAFHLPEQIEEELKLERQARLVEAQKKIVAARLGSWEGKRIPILLEDYHAETDLLLSGRASWQAPETDGEVIVNDSSPELIKGETPDFSDFLGRFCEVEITSHTDYDLVGTLLGLSE